MTIERKKEYLSRYLEISREIDELCIELYEWRGKAVKITTVISSMPRANSFGSRMQDSVERITEIEDKISSRIEGLIAAREEIIRAIEQVNDSTLRLLLKYHYIQGFTWEKIADRMHYTSRHVTRLHGQALDLINCPVA